MCSPYPNAQGPNFEESPQLTCLKGLCHGQKCLKLFSDFEAYHEQIGLITSSNGRLDIALSNAHT